jgi:hypothetical protein
MRIRYVKKRAFFKINSFEKKIRYMGMGKSNHVCCYHHYCIPGFLF